MKISFKKERGYLIPLNDIEQDKISKLKDGTYQVNINNMDLRTIAQNSSLHLWCEQIARYLNDNGLYMEKILKLETQWTMLKVKENIFRPTMEQIHDKKSTTQLEKKDFDLVIDSIIKAFGTKGISIPDFPTYNIKDK